LLFFAAAIVLKLIFLVTVSDSPFVTELTSDEWHHWNEALGILSNGLIRPDAFYFAPLYPYLLAGIYALIGPSLTATLVLNATLGAATVALTFALAFVMTGRHRTARMAAAGVLLFAPFYMYEVFLLKTTAAATLSIAALLLLMLARRRDHWALWFISGLGFGWLALLRGNTLVVLPFVAVALIIDHLDGRLATPRLILWTAAVVIGILPATVHNLVAAHDLVPTTYQGGTQFWIGNHPGASGTYVPLRPGRGLPGQERFDAISLAEEAAGHELSPSQVSAFWFRQGIEYVRSEPGAWLRLMVRKTGLFLANDEIVDVVHISVFSEHEPQLRLAFLPFGFLAALAIPGIWFRRTSWHTDLPVWATAFGSLVSVVLFFVFGRYRVPIAPLLAVLAGVGIDQFIIGLRAHRWFEISVAATLTIGIGSIALLPVPESSPLISYNTLGGLYLRQGRAEEARACFEKVVTAYPNNTPLRVNLALALEQLGDPCTAARHRETVDTQWWLAVTRAGDLVDLIQYLKNADQLQLDSAVCQDGGSDPKLRARMTSVAQNLDVRHRQGLFQPSEDVEILIARYLQTNNLSDQEP